MCPAHHRFLAPPHHPLPSHAERFQRGYFGHVITRGPGHDGGDGDHARKLRLRGRASAQRQVPHPGHEGNLGFTPAQWQAGLAFPEIGNTYAGSLTIGLTAICRWPNRVSASWPSAMAAAWGSDVFDILVTSGLWTPRNVRPRRGTTSAARVVIDYATYARYCKKSATHSVIR